MPLKKLSLRSKMQAANSAAFDVPAPVVTPETDLQSGGVFQYGAKKDPAEDLVNFEWPGHAPQGSQDDTPTQVFSDQEIETGKLAKPVRRRLTDAEARKQAIDASRSPRPLRQAAEEAAQPVKTIAQDVAEVRPNLPMGPLAGQGSMEGKPVETVIDRRGSNLGRMAGERRASSGNMVTATPSNADIGEATIKPIEDITTAEGRQAKLFPDSDAGFPRAEAQAVRDAYQSPTLRERATGAIQKSSARNVDASMLGEMKPSAPAEFDIGRVHAEAERMDPSYKPRPASATAVTTPPPVDNAVGTAMSKTEKSWTAAAEAGGRAAGEVFGAVRAGNYGTAALRSLAAGRDVAFAPFKYMAEPAVKAAQGIAARNQRTRLLLEGLSEKTLARRMAAGALPRAGRALGNTAEAVGGAFGVGGRALGVAADIAAMETTTQLAQASTEARQGVNATQKAQLESYKQQGQNYGFDVTGREGSDAYMQAKAFVGASPKIEVRPNASLRERYEIANKQRIRKLIASGAITPVATGRPTITGGGNE